MRQHKVGRQSAGATMLRYAGNWRVGRFRLLAGRIQRRGCQAEDALGLLDCGHARRTGPGVALGAALMNLKRSPRQVLDTLYPSSPEGSEIQAARKMIY